MSKMVQIRNVPDELHRKLKSRAAKQGKSLSDYLLGELSRTAEVPTLEEMFERLNQRSVENPSPTPTEIIRQDRDSR